MEYKKFSLAYSIVDISPSHVHFKMFSGMILSEYDHHETTSRGCCGDVQCMSCQEFRFFVDRSQPHLIFCEDDKKGKLFAYTGLELL